MVEPHRICHECYNGNVRLPVRSIDQISVLGLAQNTCRPSPTTRKCRWLEWFSQHWSWSPFARALCTPSSVTPPDKSFFRLTSSNCAILNHVAASPSSCKGCELRGYWVSTL